MLAAESTAMRLDRAAMTRRLRFGGLLGIVGRVLGIGLSWALAWLVVWVSFDALVQFPPSDRVSPGEMALRLGLTGLLMGIPVGVAHEVAGRERRASEFSLTRTLVCAFLACAFEQILFVGYREYRDPGLGLGLGTSVRVALAACVFGQFVTMVWYALVCGGTRALALTGRRL